MIILVDTNRVIAALMKNGTSRQILFDTTFQFVTPDHTLIEIKEHKEELLKKTKLTETEFEIFLALILERMIIIPSFDYKLFIEECKKDISDVDDIPYLACALAVNANGIWAHDPHFLEQKKVKVFTNIDMLRLAGKNEK